MEPPRLEPLHRDPDLRMALGIVVIGVVRFIPDELWWANIAVTLGAVAVLWSANRLRRQRGAGAAPVNNQVQSRAVLLHILAGIFVGFGIALALLDSSIPRAHDWGLTLMSGAVLIGAFATRVERDEAWAQQSRSAS